MPAEAHAIVLLLAALSATWSGAEQGKGGAVAGLMYGLSQQNAYVSSPSVLRYERQSSARPAAACSALTFLAITCHVMNFMPFNIKV